MQAMYPPVRGVRDTRPRNCDCDCHCHCHCNCDCNCNCNCQSPLQKRHLKKALKKGT